MQEPPLKMIIIIIGGKGRECIIHHHAYARCTEEDYASPQGGDQGMSSSHFITSVREFHYHKLDAIWVGCGNILKIRYSLMWQST